MNAADKLFADYQRRLWRLQETCPHSRATDWVEEDWAPGHPTGRGVQLCANCNKVLRARRPCQVCGKLFPEEKLRRGDGRALPLGGTYCERCHREELLEAEEARKWLGE